VPEYLSLACYILLFLGHCLFVIRAEAIKRHFGRNSPKNRDVFQEPCETN